jgi:predicted O-methyltransferase YrrM
VIDLEQFKMNPGEETRLKALIREAQPKLLAEFGAGLSTRLWAENSEARIVSWDNYPDWLAALREAFASAAWLSRVDFRLYSVTPEGPRSVEKDPVPWEGEKFDFLFLDGPRSAHPPSYGRSGSFRFATMHAAPGAMIVWHDAQRPHEREMARHYFGHCRRNREGSVGWCRWEAPDGSFRQTLNRWNPFA